MEMCASSGSRGSRSPPPGEVWHDAIATQVQIGLIEDAPPAGAAATAVERSAQGAAQTGTGVGVSR
jgi:hypothetical protein